MKSRKTKFSSESDIIDLYEKTLLKFQNYFSFKPKISEITIDNLSQETDQSNKK